MSFEEAGKLVSLTLKAIVLAAMVGKKQIKLASLPQQLDTTCQINHPEKPQHVPLFQQLLADCFSSFLLH